MKKTTGILAILAVAISVIGSPAGAEKADVQAPKGKLMFFMNPHGMPCQMQDRIITEAGEAITKAAKVVYVKTTVTSDRKLFYQYGIRALPSLVLVDAEGKTVHRFPAGIQSSESITKALSKLNQQTKVAP